MRRIIIAFIVFSLFLTGVSASSTLKVPSQYATIQMAIDASTNGDTIIVAAGNHNSPSCLVFDTKRNICLLSEDGKESTVYSGTVEISYSNNIVVKGFTINGHIAITCNVGTSVSDCSIINSSDFGIDITSCPGGAYSNVEIVDNVICGNTSHGIQAELSGGEGCISGNKIYGNGETGIFIRNSYGEISNNVIYGNSNNGISINHATFLIRNNTIAGNALAGISLDAEGGSFTQNVEGNIVALNEQMGIFAGPGINPIISCNDVWSNSQSAGLNYAGIIGDQTGQNGNISTDPLFCNPGRHNFSLAINSPAFIQGCGLMGAISKPGCIEPAATAISTWGRIKSIYR